MKRLSEFTVAELEGLPVGVTVVWTYKGRVWHAVRVNASEPWIVTDDHDEDPKMSHHNIRQVARDYNAIAYAPDGTRISDATPPNPLHEALAPFAKMAEVYYPSAPDDFVLLQHGELTVTLGDFRRAARALEAK
jgi:hypothetical protein